MYKCESRHHSIDNNFLLFRVTATELNKKHNRSFDCKHLTRYYLQIGSFKLFVQWSNFIVSRIRIISKLQIKSPKSQSSFANTILRVNYFILVGRVCLRL